nr:MAG TPA: hypothetical protein [Caudoviricetes sp.]
MVKLYIKKITQGEMTLEQVPSRWREEVRKELEKIKDSNK